MKEIFHHQTLVSARVKMETVMSASSGVMVHMSLFLPGKEKVTLASKVTKHPPLLSEQHTEDFWKHSEFFKEPPPHCDVGNYVYPSLFISVPFQALEWFSSANSVFA